MHVGITTVVNVSNYGAVLQAAALKKKAELLGHTAEVINYSPEGVIAHYKPFSAIKYKKITRKNPGARGYYYAARSFASDLVFFPTVNKLNGLFADFRRKYCGIDGKENDNPDKIGDYDCILAGSDQIWNPEITFGYDRVFFLENAKEGTIRASYAASIGKNALTDEETKGLCSHLSSLDFISVREKTAAEIIKNGCGITPDVVLDPTLLLTKNDWTDMLGVKKTDEKYIFVFTVSGSGTLDKVAEDLSEKTGLKIITFNKRKAYKNEDNRYLSSPVDFVSLVANAEYIVTNSFHGTAFSVTFGKKFVSVLAGKRTSRITDLLETVGLSNHCVTSADDYSAVYEDIDYEKVGEILAGEREKSVNYLGKVFSKEKKA